MLALPANTSPRLVSTFTSAAAPGSLMPSQLLPFLYRLARVHQEDLSYFLAKSRPLLKNVLTYAPSVSSQHFWSPSSTSQQFRLPTSSTSQHFRFTSH